MKLFLKLLFFLAFIGILVVLIAYARGYRFDMEKRLVKATGIIAATSNPKAARIYINSELKDVTDTNLTLPPDNYTIDIKKDGYTSWTKKINLKGELVINVDPVLFPINPSLSPLTNLGVVKAYPSDDNNRIVILASDAIYLFDTGKQVLPFFPPLSKILDLSVLPNKFDLDKIDIIFSPDQSQGIFEFSTSEKNSEHSYLLSLGENNPNPLDVTQSQNALIKAWQTEKDKNFSKILETYPSDFDKIASASFNIISFSPTETKVLYQAQENTSLPLMIKPPLIATNQTPEERMIKKNSLYVYDLKEDKNFLIASPKTSAPPNLKWYYDSRHLVAQEGTKITIVDYDNTNKQTVYSGPFESGFFSPTNDGKIIVLVNLNSQVNLLPDLYLVGIR